MNLLCEMLFMNLQRIGKQEYKEGEFDWMTAEVLVENSDVRRRTPLVEEQSLGDKRKFLHSWRMFLEHMTCFWNITTLHSERSVVYEDSPNGNTLVNNLYVT